MWLSGPIPSYQFYVVTASCASEKATHYSSDSDSLHSPAFPSTLGLSHIHTLIPTNPRIDELTFIDNRQRHGTRQHLPTVTLPWSSPLPTATPLKRPTTAIRNPSELLLFTSLRLSDFPMVTQSTPSHGYSHTYSVSFPLTKSN